MKDFLSEYADYKLRTVSCLRDHGAHRQVAFYIREVNGAPCFICNGCEDENGSRECAECKSRAVKAAAEDINRALSEEQSASQK